MKWVTRARPKTDRIACPWLIRRFIDPGAEILYVPAEQVLEVRPVRVHGPSTRRAPNSTTVKGAAPSKCSTPPGPASWRSVSAGSMWKPTTIGSSSERRSSTTPYTHGPLARSRRRPERYAAAVSMSP